MGALTHIQNDTSDKSRAFSYTRGINDFLHGVHKSVLNIHSSNSFTCSPGEGAVHSAYRFIRGKQVFFLEEFSFNSLYIDY